MRNLLWALGALVVAILFAGSPVYAANCSGYPYTLTNGQTADATQVMANFNTILSCANSNLAHNGANSDITSLSAVTGLSNSTLANMADQTIKGNVSGGAATPSDLTATQVETMIQGKLPFEFYVFVGGLTGNAWNLAAYVPSTNVILATGKSACVVGTGATGTTTYTIKDNGSSIGTAVITASSTTCTATITSSPYTVTAGHTITLVGPATGDATAADVGITFGGTRG